MPPESRATKTWTDCFATLGLLLFGIGLTWLLTVVLGRVVSRRGFAFWVWDRSGVIGRVLIGVGFGLALIGLGQGAASTTGKLAPGLRRHSGNGRDLADHARALGPWPTQLSWR